jgi:hypothetical protein
VTWSEGTRKKLYVSAWSEICDTEPITGFYNLAGNTSDGRPFFKKSNGKFIYFKADCGGHQRGWPMWVLDSTLPNATLTTDLDGDDGCSVDAKSPYNVEAYPSSGEWTIRSCTGGAGFSNMHVSVTVGGRATCGKNECVAIAVLGFLCQTPLI